MNLKFQALDTNYKNCCHLFRDPIKEEESGGTDVGPSARHRQNSLFSVSALGKVNTVMTAEDGTDDNVPSTVSQSGLLLVCRLGLTGRA